MQQIRYYDHPDKGLKISLKDFSKKLFEIGFLTEKQSFAFYWEARLEISKRMLKGFKSKEIYGHQMPLIFDLDDFFIDWTFFSWTFQYLKQPIKRNNAFIDLIFMCDDPPSIRHDKTNLFIKVDFKLEETH